MNTTTLGSKESSRATTTFWMLPPESEPAGVCMEGVEMLYSPTSSSAWASMTSGCVRPCTQNGAVPMRLLTRFSATLIDPTMPSPSRSSVT